MIGADEGVRAPRRAERAKKSLLAQPLQAIDYEDEHRVAKHEYEKGQWRFMKIITDRGGRGRPRTEKC